MEIRVYRPSSFQLVGLCVSAHAGSGVGLTNVVFALLLRLDLAFERTDGVLERTDGVLEGSALLLNTDLPPSGHLCWWPHLQGTSSLWPAYRSSHSAARNFPRTHDICGQRWAAELKQTPPPLHLGLSHDFLGRQHLVPPLCVRGTCFGVPLFPEVSCSDRHPVS